MNAVTYEAREDVAVVTVDYPPVNALSVAVRTGLAQALARANEDASIKAIVLRCRGGTFIAGADLGELAQGRNREEPTLSTLQAVLERGKPTVAAIHGAALGGGYELALACAARVALADARIGLPEVALGLLPGAGGTQRFTRLCGPKAALDVIVSGRHVSASEACAMGAIDAVVVDLDDAALAYARTLADAPQRAPVIERTDKIACFTADLFAAARKDAQRRARGALAPAAIIDCIEKACLAPPEEGLAFERAAFERLNASDQRKALTYYFFAERQARKVPGLPQDAAPAEINHAAVIGAGLMGRGIAVVFANAGVSVALADVDMDAAKRGLEAIGKIYASSVERGALSSEAAAAAYARIRASGFDEIGAPDIVIEAAPEMMALKRDIFARLDAMTPPHTILASNTSSLNIDHIAAATKRPEKVIGAHFFSPAHIMKLLEVVRGAHTDASVIATLMTLAPRLKKIPVLAGNCDGFIGNRMLQYYTGQSEFLMEGGVEPARIDAIAEAFGMPMGPVAMRDMAGIDVSVLVRKERAKTLPPGERLSPLQERMVEAGRLGQKNGLGFYRYEGGKRLPDPDAQAIIDRTARELGVSKRDFTDGQIRDRLFMPLVNEGAKELEEGVAIRASDIDVVYVNGYGFPRLRGGPMYWGESIGLDQVLTMAEQLGAECGPRWRPSALLQRLVRDRVSWRDAGY